MTGTFKILLLSSVALAAAACSREEPAPATDVAAATAPAAGELVRLDPAMDALVAPDAQIEKVATGFKFTEGPMWRGGRLWFSDLVGNQMIAVTPQGEVEVLLEKAGGLENPPEGAYLGSNGMVTDKDGAVLMTQHGLRRIARLDDKMATTTFLDKFEGKRLNSPNDLVFSADGALWFTDPPYGLAGQDEDPAKEVPFNGVYRYAGGKLTAMIRDLPRPNGLGFSPDGKTLYVANTGPEMFVRKYPVAADGSVGAGTDLITFTAADGEGVPDGLKIDTAGNVWVTGPGGVTVVSPEGKKLGVIKLPEVAANIAWADDGQTAYITGSTSIYRIKLAGRGQMPLHQR
jgi:gluconolactonase